MRYMYSVIRFVPDPTRGERTNLGLLVGSEESGEWSLELVPRRDRARKIDDQHILPNVVSELERLAGLIAQAADPTEYEADEQTVALDLTEQWLDELSEESGNVIQYSRPQPVLAGDLTGAIDKLWPLFIVEYEPAKRGSMTKHGVYSQVRQQMFAHRLARENVRMRATLRTAGSHSPIDLAVHNGRAVHLTQCWSFQVQRTEQLLSDIKSWAWTVRDLRNHEDAHILRTDDGLDEAEALSVAHDVPIAVVYVPPTNEGDQRTADQQRRALEEALRAFDDEDVDASAVTLDHAGSVAEQAAQSLGAAGH